MNNKQSSSLKKKNNNYVNKYRKKDIKIYKKGEFHYYKYEISNYIIRGVWGALPPGKLLSYTKNL